MPPPPTAGRSSPTSSSPASWRSERIRTESSPRPCTPAWSPATSPPTGTRQCRRTWLQLTPCHPTNRPKRWPGSRPSPKAAAPAGATSTGRRRKRPPKPRKTRLPPPASGRKPRRCWPSSASSPPATTSKQLSVLTSWSIFVDMDSAGMPLISCLFAPSLDTPAHIELAERLGSRRAWCYDSPALCADPWMILALAAGRTRSIGLGPASLVPSLRHPVVTAAALATLAGLAPGRVSTAFGTGLTGRMLLGERPMRWADVEEYVAAVRALLRGEEASWNGSLVRLGQPAGFAASLPADVAVLIAADGPRGRAVVAGLGDGVLPTRAARTTRAPRATRAPRQPSGPGSRQVLLTFGTVLDEGEDAAGPRAVAAAGPAVAAAYHAIYESKGADGVDRLPGGREWRQAVEAVEPSRRHLAVHDGHLIALSQHDQALLARAAPLLASWTMTGTRTDIGARLRALTSAGITEVAYQPMGEDIPRELAAFAQAAGLETEGA